MVARDVYFSRGRHIHTCLREQMVQFVLRWLRLWGCCPVFERSVHREGQSLLPGDSPGEWFSEVLFTHWSELLARVARCRTLRANSFAVGVFFRLQSKIWRTGSKVKVGWVMTEIYILLLKRGSRLSRNLPQTVRTNYTKPCVKWIIEYAPVFPFWISCQIFF